MPVPGESGHIEAHNKWNQFVQDARNGKVTELVGPRGPVGSRGPVGPEGPQGLQGEKGDQGPIGPTGKTGPEGPQGAQGPQGPRGQGITLKGVYDTLQALKQAHPTGKVGDAYFVKDTESLYVWDGQTQAWVDAGSIEGPPGPQGPQGVEGPAGPTGPQGPQGPTGETGPQGPAGKDGVASATYPVEYDENTRDVSLNPLLGMVEVQPINDDVGPGVTVRSGPVDSVVNEDLGVVHDAARIAFEHNKSGYDGWITKYTNRLAINSSDRVAFGVGDDVSTALEVVAGNDVNVRNDLTVQGDVTASTVHANGQDVGAALSDLQSSKAPVVNPTLMGSVSLPETTEYAGEQLSDRFAANGLFYKESFNTVAFTKTGTGTAEIKAGTKAWVNNKVATFANATSITMPSLTAGTDYFIYVIDDGSVEAVAATGTWPTPVAAPPAGSRLIGGFHYAPGGNATGASGGNTTAQINEYSFWDLKWRPAAPDPRGMTLVNDHFWSDIYLLNTTASTNGTSANDKTIWDTKSWWDTAEELGKYGKRHPRYREFCDLAYGTTENQSRGNDPVTTGLGTTNTGSSNTDQEFTSKWGVIQATGCLWVWGDEFGGGHAAASWEDINGGRGQVYQQPNAVILGGRWGNTVNSGSRSSSWTTSPSSLVSAISGRGVCDHLRLA